MSDTPKDYVVLNNTGDEIKRILDSEESTSPGQFYKNEDALNEHIDDDDIHVAKSDKTRWDEKLEKSHRESAILDHPDGSVTKEKLSTDLLELISSGGGGSVTPEQIQESIEEYLGKNPLIETDPTVPDWAKQPNKPFYDAEEIYTKDKITVEETLLLKADKSDTYTKDEVDILHSSFIHKATYDVDKYKNNELLAKKTEEIVLYETVVDTPTWRGNITYTGELNPAFNTTDVFYVTLKNADGSALENGFFKLMNYFDEYASAYDMLFYLENYDTGYGSKIKENLPIEFTALNDSVKMRDAGVWKAAYMPQTQWKLNGNKGKLRFVCDGDFIQRSPNATFCGVAGTTKNVSYYHSLNMNEFQSDSTRQLVAYHYVGQNYKTNKLYYELEVERLSDTRYATKQFVTLRYMKYGTASFSVFTQTVNGHGAIKEPDTNIDAIQIQVAANTEGGFIRNGAVIRVTEVK